MEMLALHMLRDQLFTFYLLPFVDKKAPDWKLKLFAIFSGLSCIGALPKPTKNF